MGGHATDELGYRFMSSPRGSSIVSHVLRFHGFGSRLSSAALQAAAVGAITCGRQRKRHHCWRLYVRQAQSASQLTLTKPRT